MEEQEEQGIILTRLQYDIVSLLPASVQWLSNKIYYSTKPGIEMTLRKMKAKGLVEYAEKRYALTKKGDWLLRNKLLYRADQ